MFKKFIQNKLNWIYEKFKDDTSKMLITTGSLGWLLSSAAQIAAILKNDKISNEKKSFLLPQECIDGAINVGTFLFITLLFKKGLNKLVETGKILPKSVRLYLDKNKDLYKDKIGKIDFRIDDILAKDKANAPIKTYKTYKNYVATVGTVGASILACNIATPLIRNNAAAKIQQTYVDLTNNPQLYFQNLNSNLKI